MRAFLRPHGLDRDATPIVADALERVAVQTPRPREGLLGTAAARLAAAAALPVALYLTRPPREGPADVSLAKRLRRVSRSTRREVNQLRKSANKRARRLRKDLRVRFRNLGA